MDLAKTLLILLITASATDALSCTYSLDLHGCIGTCLRGYSCEETERMQCSCQKKSTCTYSPDLKGCTGTCTSGECIYKGDGVCTCATTTTVKTTTIKATTTTTQAMTTTTQAPTATTMQAPTTAHSPTTAQATTTTMINVVEAAKFFEETDAELHDNPFIENVDWDGDGVNNTLDNCPFHPNPGQENTDMDNSCPDGYVCQPKWDKQGDACDNCPHKYNLDQADSDGDGVGDTCDNCKGIKNPLQENADGDFFGDKCDLCPNLDTGKDYQPDTDNDKVGNECDNCKYEYNPGQEDVDGDGRGDACDICPKTNPILHDSDGDGILDECDNCPQKQNSGQEDTDGDGFGNACDKCPGKKDQNFDTDSDQIDNACDNCLTIPNTNQLDSDHDGEGDICDCNDGIQGPLEEAVDCGGVQVNTFTMQESLLCQPCNFCSANTLPTRFDWRNHNGKNWMTPVRDQKSCGSCWAHSAIGVVEAKYNIEHGIQSGLDLGEQYFVSDCTGTDPGDCLGGQKNKALDLFINAGVGTEHCYPYESGDCAVGKGDGKQGMVCVDACKTSSGRCSNPKYCVPKCQGPHQAWRINGYSVVPGNVQSMKRNLVCNGPLSVSSENWWHAVVLVGWDDSFYYAPWNKNVGVWIIKNSWGENHEDGGYEYIPYSQDPRSDIINSPIYAVYGVHSYGNDS